MNDSAPTQIRLSGLTKTYREGQRHHCVLDAVNLDIPRGATVAIRGRSGSGKSTLLNLIGGIDSPDEGSVEVGGADITLLPERARTLFRRRQIGFVYQAFNLLPTLSVAENIRLVLELNRVTGEAADQRVDALLEAVGLLDRKTALPDILSGGEQQRVAIARALAHQPSVVLADEPTGNLDDEAAAGVLDLLDRLVRKSGGTMLIATHSQRVADFCDSTLLLTGGQIEAVR
jgi:putative ABC transport system ATP-binding protein